MAPAAWRRIRVVGGAEGFGGLRGRDPGIRRRLVNRFGVEFRCSLGFSIALLRIQEPGDPYAFLCDR